MKNITISVDDDLYRQARIKAAEWSTSLPAMFQEYLVQITEQSVKNDGEFQRLQREEEEIRAELQSRRLSLNASCNLSRGELHERHAIR
jgi:ABC-type uncharacterized transport system auxiliary subunit